MGRDRWRGEKDSGRREKWTVFIIVGYRIWVPSLRFALMAARLLRLSGKSRPNKHNGSGRQEGCEREGGVMM